MTKEEREHQLQRTKMAFCMSPKFMFFTSILFLQEIQWSEKIPTMAVNGKHLLINPGFFDSLSEDIRLSALSHEVGHLALYHLTRGRDHDPMVRNIAADYVTNEMLVNAGFKLGDGWLRDERFDNMAYEQVYKILLEEKKDCENGGPVPDWMAYLPSYNSGDGTTPTVVVGMGPDILPPANEVEAAAIEAEITDMILKATIRARQAGGYGSIPGQVLIELDTRLNPRLPWYILLHNFMSNFAKDDYTWRRPNRRYLPDLIMPSAYSDRCSNLVFAVDSSGSVSDDKFSYFIQEIEVVQQELLPEKITLINFDTYIRNIYEITQSTNIQQDIKFTGRGGTNVNCVLDWAREHEHEVLLIFTDGYFGSPAEDEYPDCPVVWLIYNNPYFTAEKGEVIHIEL